MTSPKKAECPCCHGHDCPACDGSLEKAEIYNCLAYCEYQNGMDHCKNCGLDEELIDYLISQTHTDLLTTLKERVEGMKKEQLDKNDPDNYGACYAIAGFNDALSKTQALIEPLLVTDKSEGFKHANETIKNGYIGEFAGFEKDESPVFNKDLNK